MAIVEESVRWASEDQLDPVNGEPNKKPITTEFRNSGLKENQGLPLEWLNEQFNNQHKAFVELQTQINNLTVATSQPTMELVYPVNGQPYISFVDTDPATVLGFGTWVRIKGVGLIGVDESDPYFANSGITGGSTAHSHTDTYNVGDTSLTVDQLPASTPFSLDVTTSGSNSTESGTINPLAGDTNAGETTSVNNINWEGNGDTHTHTISGGVQSSEHLSPYITVYMWRRMA